MLPVILPPRILCVDSSNELYKHLDSETWTGEKIYLDCSLKDTTDYRKMTGSIIKCLLFMDFQYRDRQQEVSPHFSLVGIRTCESYLTSELQPMLCYNCSVVVDTVNSSFYCVTDYTDAGFRPLFKDYELFIIDNLVLQKEYYYCPFLLAVQRTCYLWLSNVIRSFEYRGTIVMTVFWGQCKPEKDYYGVYSCKVVLDFDFTQLQRNCDGTFTSIYNIKLGLPTAFFKSRIEKKDFSGDQDFFNKIWTMRIRDIHRRLETKFRQLYCDEDISDIN